MEHNQIKPEPQRINEKKWKFSTLHLVVGYVLSKIAHLRIYTAGNQAKTFLTQRLPNTDIADICEEYNFKYQLIFQDAPSFLSQPPRHYTLTIEKL